ncbi:hypothetical protein [Candidatus Nitrososphaera gargensis]|uniref:hypothetical protein n=1 Tax=Candidatus Nitrososphaera gargensis TaxID=497727 RepID=UPI0011E57474|nr:hypothetical protein [Candidatus Nitrososphaera gargensis]
MAALPIATFLVYLPSAEFASAQDSAERFNLNLSSDVFAPGDTVILYGKVIPEDAIVVRLFDPSGKVLRLETFTARSDGTITEQVFVWPEPSKQYPFGIYSLEVRSSIVPSDVKTFSVYYVDITGAGSSSGAPSSASLVVKLDAPTLVSTNSQFRIFVQVTYNGALVNAEDEQLSNLLGSSHIHFGDSTNATAISLSGRFHKLHEGLYYADVTLDRDGSYIMHSIAFHNGFLSHDSRVVVASSASIGSVQESVNRLNERLDVTNRSLDQTNASLNTTKNALTQFAQDTSSTIGQMRDASGQINGLILPILVLISIIIALQISLFARIRASYR